MTITPHELGGLLVLAALAGLCLGLAVGAIRNRSKGTREAMAEGARAHLEELAAVAALPKESFSPAMQAVLARPGDAERSRRVLPNRVVEIAADHETEEVVLSALNRLRQRGRL